MDAQQGHKEGLFDYLKRVLYEAVEYVVHGAMKDLTIMRRESDLFLGILFSTIGIFHFRSDKFCDGNSVDYLSCTRPSSFHYYGGLEIALIAVGFSLITLWCLKRK